MIGDRIIIGLKPGYLVLQPGARYPTSQWGYDSGQATFLTHWDTPALLWPKKGDPSLPYTKLYAVEVEREDHESTGYRLFHVSYKGLKTSSDLGGISKFQRKFTAAMDTVVARPGVYAQVSAPRYTDTFLTTTEPTLTGQGAVIASGAPPYAGTIAFPDGTVEARDGFWLLENREFERVIEEKALWSVRENAQFVAIVVAPAP